MTLSWSRQRRQGLGCRDERRVRVVLPAGSIAIRRRGQNRGGGEGTVFVCFHVIEMAVGPRIVWWFRSRWIGFVERDQRRRIFGEVLLRRTWPRLETTEPLIFFNNQERLFDSERYREKEINMKLLITKLHILNARLTFGAFLFPCLVFVLFYYHLFIFG